MIIVTKVKKIKKDEEEKRDMTVEKVKEIIKEIMNRFDDYVDMTNGRVSAMYLEKYIECLEILVEIEKIECMENKEEIIQ